MIRSEKPLRAAPFAPAEPRSARSEIRTLPGAPDSGAARKFRVLSLVAASLFCGYAPAGAQSAAPEAPAAPRTERTERGQRGDRVSRGERGSRGDRGSFGERGSRGRRGASRDASGDTENIANATYELRGFFGPSDDAEASLRIAGTDKARWMRVGDRFNGALLEQVEPDAGTATLLVNGTRQKLRLAGESPAIPAVAPVRTDPAQPAQPAQPAR